MAVWDESKHPRDLDGKFTEKKARIAWAIGQSVADLRSSLVTELPTNLPDSIPLPDEWIPRSVGAKWQNEKILMPDDSYAHFVEGTKLQNKEVFAGKGCRRKVDVRFILAQTYKGSKPEEWQKVKGWAYIQTEQGEILYAEVHWFEEPSIGKVEFKYKKQ